MSLLRTIIVVGAVIALLPSDRAQQERLQQAAVDAAHWTMTFCERNAKTCDNAGAAWDVFKTKAEFASAEDARTGRERLLASGVLDRFPDKDLPKVVEEAEERGGPIDWPRDVAARLIAWRAVDQG